MKSVLIIGLGSFGKYMGEQFIEEGCKVLAIEKSQEKADAMATTIRNIQIADATQEGFLESIGVANFDLCVVAIGGNFQDSLEITVMLSELGAKYVLALASNEVHEKLLKRNGANEVVYLEKQEAKRLAVKLSSDKLYDYFELNDEVAIYEINVPSAWVDKSIIEANVRRKYKLNVLNIKKPSGENVSPDAEYVFEENDTLIVMGNYEDVKHVLK